MFVYFTLSYSKFAKDLQNSQTQNQNTQKWKTQTQTFVCSGCTCLQDREYFRGVLTKQILS